MSTFQKRRTAPACRAAAALCALAAVLAAGCGKGGEGGDNKTAVKTPAGITLGEPFSSTEELREWMVFYYANPRPDRVVPALQMMIDEDWSSAPHAHALVFFLAEVFRQNASSVPAWIDELENADLQDWVFLARSAWTMNSVDSAPIEAAILAKVPEEHRESLRAALSAEPPDILVMPISDPSHIDRLWAVFYATGEESMIKRVIELLPLAESRESPQALLIGSAATVSLAQHCMVQPRVLAICEELAPMVREELRTPLLNIVDDAQLEIDKAKAAQEAARGGS